ncbi:MAG: LysE family transporter [Chloroflexota bacterium]|nr:LysE family transporter [Chloroflexota bacterium]
MLAVTVSPAIIAVIQGFSLCISTIIALGPQNLFLIRQGLRRQHLFATVFFSTLAEIILISLAVGGLSAIISTNNHFETGITIVGTLFLVYVGGSALLRACRKGTVTPTLATQQATTSGIQATIIAALCFAFLNPATYVDTLMVIGSNSLNFYAYDRIAFALGAVLASTIWFFILTYGASKLTHVFQSSLAWRTLDGVSGFVTLGIASTLFFTLAHSL